MPEKKNAIYSKASSAPSLALSDNGEITGYAAVWDETDLDGDIIRRGSFTRSINERVAAGKVLLMSRHFLHGGDTAEAIGEIIEAKEDAKGFWIRATLYAARASQELREKIQSSPNAFGMSVGWQNVANGFRVMETGGREFTEMKLYEVTITLFPAQEGTVGTVSAKKSDVDARVAALEQQVEVLAAKLGETEVAGKVETIETEPLDAKEEPVVKHSFASEIANQRRLIAILEREGKY